MECHRRPARDLGALDDPARQPDRAAGRAHEPCGQTSRGRPAVDASCGAGARAGSAHRDRTARHGTRTRHHDRADGAHPHRARGEKHLMGTGPPPPADGTVQLLAPATGSGGRSSRVQDTRDESLSRHRARAAPHRHSGNQHRTATAPAPHRESRRPGATRGRTPCAPTGPIAGLPRPEPTGIQLHQESRPRTVRARGRRPPPARHHLTEEGRP